MTNPVKLDRVLRAAGESLIFNGRGNSVVDFGLALKDIRPGNIQMIKLPGGGVFDNGKYLGERFEPAVEDFFVALERNLLDPFLLEHPKFVNKG